MIAGVATETMVVSTRIMKNPMHRANSAGHGSFSWTTGRADVVVGLTMRPSWHPGPTGPSPRVTMAAMEFQDLMAGPPPTQLPEDPAAASLGSGTPTADVVRTHPESPLA